MMKKYLIVLFILTSYWQVFAHPMPGSEVQLSVMETQIKGEAKIPLVELANAVGDEQVKNLRDIFFETYFLRHIKAVSDGKLWRTRIESIKLVRSKDSIIGNYDEMLVYFTLVPPAPQYLRKFTFDYDAVIHQVITHSALISVKQDWDNGIQGEHGSQQLGLIALNIPTGKIVPLEVNLQKGSWFKGFRNILISGMAHISEGTDHLLFILVLLFPAMLLNQNKKWGGFGGFKYSFTRLLKIVTAFTLGHSITLFLGAFKLLQLSAQPVEVLIAFSILVSAVHAIKPVFPGKETLVAAGFGLIHGLAFASVLSSLDLSAGRMALSILAFNLGIELMQLFVIALIVPWLILLSRTKAYKVTRTVGAILAAVAALGWVMQRLSGNANYITNMLDNFAGFEVIAIGALALFSLGWYFLMGKADVAA